MATNFSQNLTEQLTKTDKVQSAGSFFFFIPFLVFVFFIFPKSCSSSPILQFAFCDMLARNLIYFSLVNVLDLNCNRIGFAFNTHCK